MTHEFALLMTPGVVEYEQGWADGRAELMRQLAERVDCLDATWQAVPRLTWEQRVAQRIAEFEAAAERMPQHLAECMRRNEEHDQKALENSQRRGFNLEALRPDPPVRRAKLRLVVGDAPDRGPAA